MATVKNIPDNFSGHWIVMRLSALGDVVLTSGVMHYWHKKYGWTFTLLTKSAFGEIMEGHPAVREIVYVTSAQLAMPGAIGWFRAFAEKYRGSGFMDLHGTLRSRLLRALWSGPVRVYPKYSMTRRIFLRSHGRFGAKKLLALTVPQRYAMAFEETTPPESALVPRLFVSEDERGKAKVLLDTIFPELACAGNKKIKPVALHPYATHSLKAWPKENWLELVHLLDDASIPWIAVGRGENIFLQNSLEPHNLCNRTSLRELCAIFSHCSLLVTGDSGPMHIAAGAGIPVIAFFGPTTREWGFYPSDERSRVLELPLPCRPCSLHGGQDCPRNGECLGGISVKEVYENIFATLAKV